MSAFIELSPLSPFFSRKISLSNRRDWSSSTMATHALLCSKLISLFFPSFLLNFEYSICFYFLSLLKILLLGPFFSRRKEDQQPQIPSPSQYFQKVKANAVQWLHENLSLVDPNSLIDEKGQNLLMYVAAHEKIVKRETKEEILLSGINLNYQDHEGYSALHIAAINCALEVFLIFFLIY